MSPCVMSCHAHLMSLTLQVTLAPYETTSCDVARRDTMIWSKPGEEKSMCKEERDVQSLAAKGSQMVSHYISDCGQRALVLVGAASYYLPFRPDKHPHLRHKFNQYFVSFRCDAIVEVKLLPLPGPKGSFSSIGMSSPEDLASPMGRVAHLHLF